MKKLRKAFDFLLDNWTIIIFWISILATVVTYSLTLIFPLFNASTELFITFGYSSAISIFLLLLEIRKSLKEDLHKSDVFDNMTNAQPSIFKSLTAHLTQKNKKPVVLRIYGMRLSGINRTLMDFFNAQEQTVWKRDLDVYIYHCNPTFLENMIPQNMGKVKKNEINMMFKEHAKSLDNFINGLRRVSKNNNHIKIHFRKYDSMPSFWAYEIDRTELFFGYFTWNNVDWIGPENNCVSVNKNNQPIKGFIEWVNNYLDGLEDWSISYD